MVSRDEILLGPHFRKIQPKLRMFAKASDAVSFERSKFASAIAIDPNVVAGIAASNLRILADKTPKKLETPPLENLSDNVAIDAFIWRHPTAKDKQPHLDEDNPCRQGLLETKRLILSQLTEITNNDEVAYLELGEPLKRPDATVSQKHPAAPKVNSRNIKGRDSGGRSVLIGIIDLGGFDFSHEDFMRNGETRWVRIWDQKDGGKRQSPADFNYGSEITAEHMNDAIQGSATFQVPAWALEKQSQNSSGSHGTHVASIAAATVASAETQPLRVC